MPETTLLLPAPPSPSAAAPPAPVAAARRPKRYYTLREVYRKYAIHLKKTFSQGDVGEYERQMRCIRQHLEWLKVKSLTIYTTTKEHLQMFFQYLFSYCDPIKGYYREETLVRRLREVYRFYVWLAAEQLLSEDIFSKPLRREIRHQIRSRDRPAKPSSTDPPAIPGIWRELYEEACSMDEQRRYHVSTQREHKKGWKLFLNWLEEVGIQKVDKLTAPLLVKFQAAVRRLTNNQGHRISVVVQLRRLIAVKRLLEGWYLTNRIKQDLGRVIELPKCSRGLGHVLMNYHEVEKLLSLPEVTTLLGLRDKALLEVFFSTGMRLSEVCHLKVEDILFTEGMVRVMVPKGGKAFQRVVAIGEVALDWVKRYLAQVRPDLIKSKSHPYLFVHRGGGRLRAESVIQLMRYYRFKGGFKKPISSHSFRVTCATEMLRHRADIRYVQAQLGHTSLQSTQIYTRVLPTDLKKVHQRTHPRERRRQAATP